MAVNIEGRLLKPVADDGSLSRGPLMSRLYSFYPKDGLVYIGEWGPYSEFYLVDYDELRLQNNHTGVEFNVVPRKLINDHDNYYKVVPIDKSDVFDTYTLKFGGDNMEYIYDVNHGIDKETARFNMHIDHKTAFKYAGYVLDDDKEEK